MKLLCGILIGLIIFSSCSSDDNSNPDSVSIVGIWKPIKDVSNCSSGNQNVLNFTTCQQTSRLIFNENGTFSETAYIEDGTNCIINFEGNGDWEINDGEFSMDILVLGTFQQMTFFELTNNTLKLGQNNTDPSFTCNDGSMLSNFYVEYSKVE
ncbi:lipocalin family protein [Aequorivita sp. 609]|uniref:lipocalin family protein n=1 Tax=Aequorivita TaxID=153265 RepID=UPI0016175F7A|nr:MULTISPECIES: lipocalin family protein [Aequorivita]MBB6682411.1 lipocalin family protein [Aequorivita sp. 609]